jgi:predicted metal-dependent hydrolase
MVIFNLSKQQRIKTMDKLEQVKAMVLNNVKEHQTVFYSTDEIMAKLYVWAAVERNKQEREEAVNDDEINM